MDDCKYAFGILISGGQECREANQAARAARKEARRQARLERIQARTDRKLGRQDARTARTQLRTENGTPIERFLQAHGERAAGVLGGFFGGAPPAASDIGAIALPIAAAGFAAVALSKVKPRGKR